MPQSGKMVDEAFIKSCAKICLFAKYSSHLQIPYLYFAKTKSNASSVLPNGNPPSPTGEG
ncbi:MAG: hypothetical protein E7603_09830 [Ruminococcaceae bacterium]|nr:hypothetical protein [Oscillospiraceae bacterium]